MSRSAIAAASFLAVILVAAWLHYLLLTEAYGPGPPYFGRTTNMDKWTSPWPALIFVEVIVLAIGSLLLLWRRRHR